MEKAAGCIIVKYFNEVPHILMAHPAGNWKNKKFGFPKGHLEEGEDLTEGAKRETIEESGITPDILEYLGSVYTKNKKKKVHAFIALYKSGPLDGKKATNFQKEEVDVVKFYPIDKAIQMAHPYQKELFEKAKEYVENEL
jgi:ADP-ribose pyrophosphatase YjhB (NUDIX family)